MTESSYVRSLRAIKPAEVDLFAKRRDNGVYRDTPPEQALFEAALVAAWTVHQRGVFVTPESIHAECPELTELQIAEICESPFFRQSLEARGIPGADALHRLTGEQLTVLQVMTDPSISSDVMTRLKRLGVSYKRWQGWLRQPVFAATYTELLEKLRGDTVGPTMVALQQQSMKGDVPSARLTLEIAGVYVPGGSTMQEERRLDTMVQRLQEAIDLFVDDETTRHRIADFVRTGKIDQGELVSIPMSEVVGQ